MLKNKLCKSIIDVLVSVAAFILLVVAMGFINSYAEEDYKIYAEEGDIRSYITGEGTYFNSHRSFYRDSKGQVVYCLQSGVVGASTSGTSGYRESNAPILSSDTLVNNINNIVANGYPYRFGTYAVGGTDKEPIYKTGLLIDGNIYICTKEEARAATAFAIHKKMSEFKSINPDAAAGNDETIINFKNGSLATNNVADMSRILLEAGKINNEVLEINWSVIKSDGNFDDVENLTVSHEDKDGNLCVYAHITSNNCYVDNIYLSSDDSYVQGAYIDEIKYVSAFEKYICVKIPNSAVNYTSNVGITCSAGVLGAEAVQIMGNPNFQDIIVVPSKKFNGDAYLKGQMPHGEGKLYKTDYDTNQPIPGVVYGIYKDPECKSLIMSVETGSDGYASTGAIDCGVYYIKEIECRNGYLLDTEVYEFSIVPNKKEIKNLYNKRIPISIEVLKTDYNNQSFTPQGDATLEGAVYGLYAKEKIEHIRTGEVVYQKDSLVSKIVIDKDGKGRVNNLHPGEYYIKELTPPIGYTMDDTIYDIDCNIYDSSLNFLRKKIIVSDISKKQAFQLVKFHGQEGEEQKPLEGAGFCAWLISDLEIDETGKYDFNGAKPFPIGVGDKVEMYTDETGYACSAELPYGKYIVRETTVPEGFQPIDDFTVTITEDSRQPQILRMFNDEKIRAALKIIKIDGATGRTILEPGYKFKIFDLNNNIYIKQKVSYPKDSMLDTFETNEEGYLILPDKLPVGAYRIEEVEVPDGSKYAMNKDGLEINITSETVYKEDNNESVVEVTYPNTPITGNLIIHKLFEQSIELAASPSDADSGSKVEFGLYAAEDIFDYGEHKDEDGKNIVKYSTDTRICTIDIDNDGYGYASDLPIGKYYLVEEKTLDGYVRKDEQIPFEVKVDDKVNDTIIVVELEVENILTAVGFIKKDYTTNNILTGATLMLKDSDGNVLERWVSKNTPHIVKGLSIGREYTLVEEYAPYGYLKADDVTFTVSDGIEDKNVSITDSEIVQEVIIYDKSPVGRITVNKYGEVISHIKWEKSLADESESARIEFDERPLLGVEFALYAAEDIICADDSGKVIYASGSKIMTALTDDKGIAVFDNLALGSYLLVEIKSDSEHIVRPYSIPIMLEYVNQYTELVEAKSRIENDRIECRIKINKIDSDLNIPLSDAVFGLYSSEDIYDINGNLIFPKDSMIDRKISDESGTIDFYNSLIPGQYYVKELEAPDNYILSDEKYSVVVKPSEDTEIVMNIDNKRVGLVMGESGVYEIKETSQQVKTGDDFNPAVAVMLIISIIGMIIISVCLYLKAR